MRAERGATALVSSCSVIACLITLSEALSAASLHARASVFRGTGGGEHVSAPALCIVLARARGREGRLSGARVARPVSRDLAASSRCMCALRSVDLYLRTRA